jgi:hypothetical protein
MRWLFRRWVELVFLAMAVGALWKGFHLPPPIGQTIEVRGAVHNVEFGAGNINFAVGHTAFSSNSYEPGYKRLSRVLTEGVLADVVAWPGGAWPDERSVALGISVDGVTVVSRTSRLTSCWLLSIASLALGAAWACVVVYAFRSRFSLWQHYRARLEKRLEVRVNAREIKR